ncbi:DUF624 domain-containing protein [Haloactinopolyspora alba]|uniref:DUF624 domain-containing protein n=1 Tax=Haloactinopolyspora alba TaxID=648780 RepID=UPI0013EBB87E|nr:DUF624 domain-containing protein [Haloactinopolyspora alba]
MATPDGARRNRWEHRVLAALAYPANLAFAGVAAFLLALPIVTWLPASVAAGRAMHGWLTDGDDRVFTTTMREFAATWRRTMPAGLVATAVATVFTINLVFLGSRDAPVAFLLATAMLPFAAAFVLVIVMLPVAAARWPDASMRRWLTEAVALAAARPVASAALVVIVAAFGLTCVLVPTIVPFFGLSVPVWLGLATARVTRGPQT